VLKAEEVVKRMSARELFQLLLHDISALFDRQLELAKQEALENLKAMIFSAGLLIGGLVVLSMGVIALLVAAILALSLLMPGWLAGILVFVFLSIVGGILALLGRGKLVTNPLEKTRETIKEDIEWARTQVTSNEK
jgi:hypothetical protein